MRAETFGFDPSALTALDIFVGAGFLIALALVCAGLMTFKKDQKAAKFYFIAAAISGGVALALLGLAFVFGNSSQQL